MNEEMRETRRELALRVIDRNYEYSESILKWCFTTLTALNGGALVTLVGIDSLRGEVLRSVGWYFGSGILCSIIASFLISFAYGTLAQRMAEKLWRNTLLDRDSFKGIMISGTDGMWAAGLGFFSALVSGSLLALGGLEVAQITAAG